jgi:hypothetical protein
MATIVSPSLFRDGSTADVAPVPRASTGSRRAYRTIDMRVVGLVIALVAIAARWRTFGNPIIHIDEQFYLLVGGRMWEGAIPYVDIFDRKPIGLFLLYAAFRAGGGSGVLTYQIAALVSVWATAMILYAMGRRVAPPLGALAGALLYVLWLNLAGGEGGQAPVFYNLPVAAAVALIFFRREQVAASGGDMRWPGTAAMLLFGLALQIKYSVVFEGMFAGIMLLWMSWRGGRPLGRLAIDTMLWVSAALLPTLLAVLGYAAMGHLDAWWFANGSSILARKPEMPDTVWMRIKVMTALVVPLVACIVLRRWTGARPASLEAREELRFLDGWAAAALLGVVLFGTWFNHYALPLFAPFAVTAAPLWHARWGRVWLVAMLAFLAVKGQHLLYRHTITRGTPAVLAAAVDATKGSHGCLFVYDGLPALYDATNSCLPTTRPFPAHLQSKNEMGATGIDQATEVARVMAARPERVMTMDPAYPEENMAARSALYRVLGPNYRELFRYTGGEHQYVVYGRNDVTPPRAPVRMGADKRFF